MKEQEDSFEYSPKSARGKAIASLAVAITPSDASPAEDALDKDIAARAVSQSLSTAATDDVSDLTISTTKPASKPKKTHVCTQTKGWNDRIKSDPMATPSEDRWSILCAACLGQGRNKGVVKMRHAFALSAWDEHCSGKRHSSAAANIAAEKNETLLKDKKQKSMANFFPVLKKSKNNPSADDSSSKKPAYVDLTGSPDKKNASDVVDLTSTRSLPVE